MQICFTKMGKLTATEMEKLTKMEELTVTVLESKKIMKPWPGRPAALHLLVNLHKAQ